MLRDVRIERIEPLAGGAAFGDAGPYERLSGSAHGEIDPALPGNRAIVGLDGAPRNARGVVEYRTDWVVMRPCDPARGNRRLLYEVNNRGRPLVFGMFADAPGGVIAPRALAELGNGFPLHRGFTMAWSGWDPGVARDRGGLALDAPVAREAHGPVVRRIREQFVPATRLGPMEVFRLSHAAASLDVSRARLSVRARADDAPMMLGEADWTFVDARTVRLTGAWPPRPGHLYEFHYEARDPKIQGLGLAATRDVVSHLRYDAAAIAITGVPLTHTLGLGISQAGRYLREHLSSGFNRDEAGRRVFDGVFSHIAGAGRVFLNELFAQPWRTNTQHEDHDFPENHFPFSTASCHDPITGARASLLRADDADVRVIESNTATEYWQKGASLLHTDPLGERDLVLPENARVYLIAGTQHGGRSGLGTERGPAAHPRNPHNPAPVLRALLVALDDWVALGRPAPASRVPTIAQGTLVDPGDTGFPAIPGVCAPTRGNRIEPPGDWVDPVPAPRAYRARVCRTDADGNEVAGIRTPDIAVPLATYTGWNLYADPYPVGELADRDGSCLPFPADPAQRLATTDPRASIAERYPDHADYLARVRAQVQALVDDRLLLPEDASDYLARAASRAPISPAR